MTTIAEYRSSKELFTNLTLRDLRSKYRRSLLGWAWSMLNPLANMAVYTVVFSYFIRAKPTTGYHGLNEYALWLLAAMLPWTFFTGSIHGGVGGVTSSGNIIKKTYFPREMIPMSATAAALVMHLIEMALLAVVITAFGNWTVFEFLPVTLVLIAIVTVFSLGVSLLFSAINVFYRDIEYFIQILFLAWFYLTPIIYPDTLVKNHWLGGKWVVTHADNGATIPVHQGGVNLLTILKINPWTDIASCFRATMYYGKLPNAFEFGYSVAWAALAIVVGLFVFNRLSSRFAEEL